MVKTKVTLEQATKAQRGSRWIVVLFLKHWRYMGVGGQSFSPAALPPGKRVGTHYIGGWVGPRAGLDGRGKSRPQCDLIPEPSSPYPAAIPFTQRKAINYKFYYSVYMQEERLPKLIMEWIPEERRKRGRPRKTWMEGVQAAVKTRHLETDQWLNRKEWCLGSGRRRQLLQDRKDR